MPSIIGSAYLRPILLENSFGLSAGYSPLKNRARECLQIKISVEFRKADALVRCRFSGAEFFNTIDRFWPEARIYCFSQHPGFKR